MEQTKTKQQQAGTTQLAKTSAPDARLVAIISNVERDVKKLVDGDRLVLPSDFAVGNALRAAWLLIAKTVDKDKRPALTVCTEQSLYSSLFDMCVQGLNPTKKQCYFIVRGKELTCFPSVFGAQMMVRRLFPDVIRIVGVVVRKGEDCLREMHLGNERIVRHVKSADTDNNEIVGAYTVAVRVNRATGEEYDSGGLYMTMERIRKSWAKSASTSQDVHKQFPAEMAIRTVVRRQCELLLRTTSDKLLLEAADRRIVQETESSREEVKATAELSSGMDFENPVIDVESSTESPDQVDDLDVIEPSDADGDPTDTQGFDFDVPDADGQAPY